MNPGEAIEYYRKKNGLSVGDLAKLSQVSERTLYNYRYAGRNPYCTTPAIATALNIPPEAIDPDYRNRRKVRETGMEKIINKTFSLTSSLLEYLQEQAKLQTNGNASEYIRELLEKDKLERDA